MLAMIVNEIRYKSYIDFVRDCMKWYPERLRVVRKKLISKLNYYMDDLEALPKEEADKLLELYDNREVAEFCKYYNKLDSEYIFSEYFPEDDEIAQILDDLEHEWYIVEWDNEDDTIKVIELNCFR